MDLAGRLAAHTAECERALSALQTLRADARAAPAEFLRGAALPTARATCAETALATQLQALRSAATRTDELLPLVRRRPAHAHADPLTLRS